MYKGRERRKKKSQRESKKKTKRERNREYKEMAYATIEAEKYHNLPASWRPRKASGVIPV